VLIAGPLAETIFEPLLIEGGALVGSVGTVSGGGDGRGMAFMFVLVGVALVVMAIVSALAPSVHLLEDRIPDYINPEGSKQEQMSSPVPGTSED